MNKAFATSLLFLCVFLICLPQATAQPKNTPAADPPSTQLSAMPEVYVRQFKLEGNTVISEEELSAIAAPYENRNITSEELQELRRKLTQCYVDKGYVNSGVVIPDQEMTNGIIVLRVIEGTLTDIEITGNDAFRTGYLEDRLRLGAGPPLNVFDLRESLLILQQDPRIEQINARLTPGAAKEESALKVHVKEDVPYKFGFDLGNTVSPAIGGVRGGFHFAHNSLTGNGDVLAADVGVTEGFTAWNVMYSIPVTAQDTTVSAWYRRNDATIIETMFKNLDIESLTDTLGLSVSHPFYKRADTEFAMGLTGERRSSQSSLLGMPFSFSSGEENGRGTVTALRFFQSYMVRSQQQVFAARSTFSLGTEAFGASVNLPDPNGKFFTWLAQVQFIRRLWDTNLEMVFRADAQLSTDPLLAVEKLPIGGMNSVRGYRENRLVRDNGVASSLECRIPLFYSGGRRVFQIAPFFDYGASWNTKFPTPSPKSIYSLGLAVRWDITDKISLVAYGAIPFVKFDDADEDLQDKGFQFRFVAELF